ncbi:hypothetical protein LTS18_003356, partial [Coniosporium uncinatum]
REVSLSPTKRPSPSPSKVTAQHPAKKRKVLDEMGSQRKKKSPRKALGEIEGPNASPSKKDSQKDGLKAPEKRAVAGRKVLDQRAVLRDLMNDVL